MSASAPSHAASSPVLYTFSNEEELSAGLGSFLLTAQNEAIARRDLFTLANSGGSLPSTLAKDLLNRPDDTVNWDKWHIFFTDEELVPHDHHNSTFALCKKELFPNLPNFPRSQLHTIDEKLLDDPHQVADSYQKQLINVFARRDPVKTPRFDVVLLEMETNAQNSSSCFVRGLGLLQGRDRWVTLMQDTHDPSKKRLNISLHVLNHAHRVVFVLRGEGNQDTLDSLLDGTESACTGKGARPLLSRNCYVFTDELAAQNVKYPKTPFEFSVEKHD